MTLAVLDASVLVAALVNSGRHGRWAEGLLMVNDVAAPHLVLAEAASVLRRNVLAGTLSDQQASLAHAELALLGIELYPYAPFSARVWELRGNVTPYDAWYVALAERLGCPLYTLDARLGRTPGPICPVVLPEGDGTA